MEYWWGGGGGDQRGLKGGGWYADRQMAEGGKG